MPQHIILGANEPLIFFRSYSSAAFRPSLTGAFGQAGVKLSYVSPLQQFGAEFKKAPSYEVYYHTRYGNYENRWYSRIGFCYASFKPRLDSFPVYMVQSGVPDKLFPGYVTYHKFNLQLLYFDEGFQVYKYRGLSVNIGVGLTGGFYHNEYDQGYATLIEESSSITNMVYGFRSHAAIAWKAGRHLEIYAEGMKMLITQNNWSSNFHNNSLGIGCNITFKNHDNY